LNRVYSQCSAHDTAWRTIRVVVHANAVHTVVILLWPGAGDRDLRAETAVPPISALRKTRLGLDTRDSRLQIRQVRPAAPVQRQFANGGGIYLGAQRGRGQLDSGRLRSHLDRLTHLPNSHREVKDLLGSYRERDALLHFRGKPGRRDSNLISPGQ
jgi:hypothetical protein